MAYAPTLTPQPTSGRVPRVDVQFASFAGTAATFNLYRTVDDRQMLVAGGANIAAVAGVTVPDEQAAFTTASYRAEMFTAAGVSLGFTDATTATLTVADVWIQNTLDASLSVNLGPFGFLASAFASIKRPFDSSAVFAQNSGLARVVAGRRQGLSGIVLDLNTTTLAQADALQKMFGTYDVQQLPVVCVRTPAGPRIPRVLFLHAPDGPVEADGDIRFGGTAISWSLSGDEVAPPSPGLAVPLLTYTDLDVSYATYTARDAAYASYSASDSDYSLAGAAGGL